MIYCDNINVYDDSKITIFNCKTKSLLQTNGSFIECGSYDGETMSNSLYMERMLDWTGLLIEPAPESYALLRSKQRKSWTVQACLSPVTYPTSVYIICRASANSAKELEKNIKNHLIESACCWFLKSLFSIR